MATSLTNFVNTFVNGANLNLSGVMANITGTADYNAGTWSNPGLVPNSGANGSFSTQIQINATAANIGITGVLGYMVTYTLSGAASLTNNTPTSVDDVGNFVPTVTANLGIMLTPGGGGTAFSADVKLTE